MDSSLLGVIIGGCLALLPALASALTSLVNQHIKHAHEIRMKRLEWESESKVDAIHKYSESIGKCIADRTDESYRAYMACFECLSLYVSDETYSAMVNLFDPRTADLDDLSLKIVNDRLRSELRSAIALSQPPTCNSHQKRSRKAAHQFYHAVGKFWTAIAPHPFKPADPVEGRTYQPIDERDDCK